MPDMHVRHMQLKFLTERRWWRRAELEEKLDRLQRIVGEIDQEAQPSAAHITVERAARGMVTPGKVSPKLAEAMSGGKIAMRRRALTNLRRPVPCSLKG